MTFKSRDIHIFDIKRNHFNTKIMLFFKIISRGLASNHRVYNNFNRTRCNQIVYFLISYYTHSNGEYAINITSCIILCQVQTRFFTFDRFVPTTNIGVTDNNNNNIVIV